MWALDGPVRSCWPCVPSELLRSPASCHQVDKRVLARQAFLFFSRNRDASMKPGYSLPPADHSRWGPGPGLSGCDKLKPSPVRTSGGHRRGE